MMTPIEAALEQFKMTLARERARLGRDAIRTLPQGLLLDALDAGRPHTGHERGGLGMGAVTEIDAVLLAARRLHMWETGGRLGTSPNDPHRTLYASETAEYADLMAAVDAFVAAREGGT